MLAAMVLTACSGLIVGTPRAAMLDYQTNSTYQALCNLASAHAVNLNTAVKADTLHPGMYAEYGVALALMGHDGEACRMLNAEAKAFPESRLLVRRIKERLLPDMVGDTLAGTHDTADILKLQAWAYDSVTALQPLPHIASVIDSTDSVRVMMQTPVDSVQYPIRLTANQKRELLFQEQRQAELQRKAAADSIAAAKQAKIDARKQAKADKKKAKKEKKRLAKEKAKQRDAEKQRRAEERKAQKQKGKEAQQ